MRKLWIPAVALTVLLCGGAAPTEEAEVSPEIAREIAQWNDDLEDAYIRRDADAVATFFTEDATLVEAGRPAVQGREAIKAYFQYYMDFGVEELRSRSDELYGDDESVMEVGRSHGYLHGNRTSGSRYMCLYRKVDGRWLAHRLVSTS